MARCMRVCCRKSRKISSSSHDKELLDFQQLCVLLDCPGCEAAAEQQWVNFSGHHHRIPSANGQAAPHAGAPGADGT